MGVDIYARVIALRAQNAAAASVYAPTFSYGAGSIGRKLQEHASVRDYGAAGDNVTDDTAAIQSAIDAVSAAGGGTLFFPAGTYKVTSALAAKPQVRLQGARLFRSGTATIRQYSPTARIVTVSNTAYGFSLDGLNFQSTVTADSCIYVDVNGFSISHCAFNFTGRAAIEMSATTIANRVEYCVGINLVYQRAGLSGPVGGLHILGTDHYIANNEMNCSSGQSGTVNAGAYACAIYIGGANHFVSSNVGEFGETGFYVAAIRSRFVANRADRCMGHGWVVAGNSNVFTACQTIECGGAAANTYDGFQISGNLNTFTGCTQPAQGATTLRYGWNDTTASATQKNQYIGCYCTSACGTAAYSNAALGGGFHYGSGWYAFTSGTTIDVSGKANIYLNYTGSTIGGFAGGTSGQTISVMTYGALTIQTNANIKTVAGTNLVMAPAVIYQFTNWGGVWMQHA